MRCAGKVYRLQADTSGSAGREADGGNSGAGVSRNWGPASRAAAGGIDYAIDGNGDRKSTRLNSSHQIISYAVFCLKKKKERQQDISNEKRLEGRRMQGVTAHD